MILIWNFSIRASSKQLKSAPYVDIWLWKWWVNHLGAVFCTRIGGFIFKTKIILRHFSHRFCRLWENRIILAVSDAVFVMNAWTVFHLQSMWATKFTVLMITIVCLPQNVPAVVKVNDFCLMHIYEIRSCLQNKWFVLSTGHFRISAYIHIFPLSVVALITNFNSHRK